MAIAKRNWVPIANIAKVNGIAVANIAKINWITRPSASNWLLNNLQWCWEMDSDATDELGLTNLTATNLTYDTTTKKVGTASGDYNGSSSYCQSSTSTDLAWVWDTTMSTRIRADTLPWSWASAWVYSKGSDQDAGSSAFGMAISIEYATTPKFRAYVVTGGTDGWALTGTISVDTWYHVVWVFDNTTGAGRINIYLNGAYVTQTNVGNNLRAGGRIVLWRYGGSGGTAYFNWRIDQSAIWDRKLTTDEISALYNWWAGLPYSSFTS